MTAEREPLALTSLFYEAVLDSSLWPGALTRLADAMGVAQIAMPSFDWRARVFSTIAPRFDPDLVARYKEHWAFKDPLVPRAALRPVGQVYSLDDLMPRREFAATPIFNDWWRRAGCGLAAMGGNLVASESFSALICAFNAPGKEAISSKGGHLFATVLPHLARAVRISRQLAALETNQLASAEGFQSVAQAALLVDSLGRVVLANEAAAAMLKRADGIFLQSGRIAVNRGQDELQKLIASCSGSSLAILSAGGEIEAAREPPRASLSLTVTPLRSGLRRRELPWLSEGSPAALVVVTDNEADRTRRAMVLRRRFGFTPAEAAFAAEISRGDGRKAAARRCGVSEQTAKSRLSVIFLKTGTHRQAELVRVLLGAADEDGGVET